MFDSFEIPGINRFADVAFVAHLAGAGVTSANNQALYVLDTGNGLLPLARDGDAFEVAPGEVRTIAADAAIWFAAGAGKNSFSGLSDDRRIGFSLRFTGDSLGLFVAQIVQPANIRAIGRETNGDVHVTVSSFANLRYTLQTNESWDAGSWLDVVTSTGTGADVVLSDSAASTTRRFYRVVTKNPAAPVGDGRRRSLAGPRSVH